MNKYLSYFLLISTVCLICSCSKKDGCTDPLADNYDADADKDDGSCFHSYGDDNLGMGHSQITFNFTHNFDGIPVSSSTFNQFNYVNANDDTLSISKLRYLISDVRLYKANGDSIVINGYSLIDVDAGTGMTYTTTDDIPYDTYTGISFNFGFDSLDNADNAYQDLNIINWNWPATLGGGYHFMQMEGRYKEQGNDSLYAYHHGTARVSMGVFEQNYFTVDLAAITLSKSNVTVEIKMDIAEWYQNPDIWDLNMSHTMVMPSYTAQKMIQKNGSTVFSMGTVIQTD